MGLRNIGRTYINYKFYKKFLKITFTNLVFNNSDKYDYFDFILLEKYCCNSNAIY